MFHVAEHLCFEENYVTRKVSGLLSNRPLNRDLNHVLWELFILWVVDKPLDDGCTYNYTHDEIHEFCVLKLRKGNEYVCCLKGIQILTSAMLVQCSTS